MQRLALAIALASAGLAPLSAWCAPPSAAQLKAQADAALSVYPQDGPGAAVLVMRGDEVLYRAARGEADVEGDVPLKPGDRFRIGSVTKQMAAAGLLKLVEAGKVSLDDPLSRYVPGYPGGERITVEHLLNHTSGVKSYTGIRGTMDGPIRRDVTTAQLVDYFKDHAPDFAPGEGWKYNNSGYVLVGAVIEAASGQPWHEYLQQELFAPLGMHDTGYGADPAVVARQVKGYTREDEGGGPLPAKPLSMTQPHAAGALVSTVDDLGRWNRALHEGRVLKSDTYTRMITPAGKATKEAYGYGIGTGLVRGEPTLQHGGGIFGFSAHLLYVPGDDISVAVLHNSDESPTVQKASNVARRLAAAALGDPYPAPVPIPVDVARLKELEGVYRIDDTALRTLRVVDGNLTGQRTGGQRSVLTLVATDTFLYDDGFNRFTMLRDANGKVTGMRFWADGEGEGQIAERTEAELPPLPVEVTLPGTALDRLVGVYASHGTELHIGREGDRLHARMGGGSRGTPLMATSPVHFIAEQVGAEVTFSDGPGPAQELSLAQRGRTLALKRKAD